MFLRSELEHNVNSRYINMYYYYYYIIASLFRADDESMGSLDIQKSKYIN